MTEQELRAIFARDERIAYVVEYPEGFVPNSYKWKCPRKGIRTERDGTTEAFGYDAKRSSGRGPRWVAFSERGGRLASA